MRLEDITKSEAVDTTIRFRAGQYINKVFSGEEGFKLNVAEGRYEFWESSKQKIIIEPLHDDHCIIYMVKDK